ncbi:MAG: Zn-ribbon domain-containing OB-fold protein [Halodesulfurarchaeum sp.]
MFEQTNSVDELTNWKGHMEADYLYTAGPIGDEFFTRLRDDGTLVANTCPECGTTFVPPRLYCEDCFVELEAEFEELPGTGTVETYTVARIDTRERELDEPRVLAMIAMDGADTSLLHEVAADPAAVETGMAVQAMCKDPDDRTGEMTDIVHFEPVE